MRGEDVLLAAAGAQVQEDRFAIDRKENHQGELRLYMHNMQERCFEISEKGKKRLILIVYVREHRYTDSFLHEKWKALLFSTGEELWYNALG